MGQPVNLVATGTDPETGNLPSSAFAWHVLLHHDGHVHYLTDLTGKNASFPGPDHENPVEIWVEVQLTVTDTAGLTDTKSVNIYLDPSSVATTNLIANPSLELSTASSTLPDGWTPHTYLNTTARFTYPVAGIAGARAAKVDITAHTSGDAKWIFTPVNVTAGLIYTYSESYMASVPSYVLFDIGLADGAHLYPKVGDNIPAVGVWTPFSASYQLPANAVTLSVFHYIDSVGSLTIDNTSLTPPAGIVTPPTTNLVQNPSMESATASTTIPDHWFTNVYLNNTVRFTYPVAGSGGNSGAKVAITAHTDGDAKWIFEQVVVTPNTSYTFTDKYLSNITSHVWVDVTLTDGTHTYAALNDDVPVAATWTAFAATYQMPANAAFATVFHLISGVGELTTDEYSLVAN